MTSGARTLKDAMNEALRDWVANVHDTFYIIGTAAGPHPYPELVRDFQSVIGTRGARADARAASAACPTCWSRRSAADRTRSGCSTRSSTIPTSRCSASRRRATGSTSEHAASLAGGVARHPPRQQDLPAAGRGRPDHRGALDQRRARLSRASAPSMPGCSDIGRVEYDSGDRQRGARRVPAALPHRRHHPRARTEPRASPRSPSAAPRNAARTRSSSPTCAGAATRTSSPSPSRRIALAISSSLTVTTAST